jgi:hypothetical protein
MGARTSPSKISDLAQGGKSARAHTPVKKRSVTKDEKLIHISSARASLVNYSSLTATRRNARRDPWEHFPKMYGESAGAFANTQLY